jgi:cytoskeletal protein RodZ
MTARHQIRIGSRRLGRDRQVIDAMPAPSLGEVLQAARERKGVDLFRAERDTKIRLKYLAALEDDDLAGLPPPVYTKGFIRNYALYLGLEPEEVISRWREQLQIQRQQERVVVAPPPRPLVAPRRGVAITPGLLVALLLSVVVLAFVGYIGWQLFRYVQQPVLALTYPSANAVIDADSVTMRGTAGPAAVITITGPDQEHTVRAGDPDGTWAQRVTLSKGRNEFVIVATDSVTNQNSSRMAVLITVPLPDLTGSPPPILGTPAPIELGLTSPSTGSTSSSGRVTVAGTTSGTRITIDQLLLGPVTRPGATPTVEPEPEPEPEPEGPVDPAVTPQPSPAPAGPVDITVPVGGRFSHTLQLDPGRWQLTVTAYATGLEPVSQTRTVTVTQTAGPPVGEAEITLVLEGRGGSSWMRIVVDGELLRPRQWGGPTLGNGETVTITAEREIFFRTGNAGVVHVTLNGREVGLLGNRGQVGNWIIEPGSDPRRTSETR